jgi:tripartite-type tricarboxylate transporter receptor subunit TctC
MRIFARMIALLLLTIWPAAAQEWPQRTTTIVVGFAPGSAIDLLARVIAENLQSRLGHPFIVENRVGAGGTLAVHSVARAQPDGHVLGATVTGPLVVNPLMSTVGYDPLTDLTPVTIFAATPSVLVVRPSLGVSTVAELIDLLKKHPGKFTYSSVGPGSMSHLSIALVAHKSGTEVVHAPYRGTPDAMQALLSGTVEMASLPPLVVEEPIKDGRIKGLAITSAAPWPTLPDVPTFAAIGFPIPIAWFGVFGPAKLPAGLVDKLHKELMALKSDPAVQEKVRRIGFQLVGNRPTEFAQTLREEQKIWKPVLEAVGLAKK